MILWSWRRPSLRLLAAMLLTGGLGALGCGSKSQPEAAPSSEPQAPTARKVVTGAGPTATVTASKPVAPVVRDRMHQAFDDATLGPDSPPADSKPPVDQTITGKSGPRLLDQVREMWHHVAFVSSTGKKIHYTADVFTDRGTIKLALLPQLAPNHVRNFIVLARVGYFDGLCFDRIHNEIGEMARLSQIEAGCPRGTGETGTGSIGYWMKDELTPTASLGHEVGVVGACRGVEADTAATKFYINLEKAPYLDGTDTLFAKVIGGLDVARTIGQEPVTTDPEDGSRARPQKPVVIHRVTIHEHETEATPK